MHPANRNALDFSGKVLPITGAATAKLPNGRVIGPAYVAALAVHMTANTTLTGATYDVDGAQQVV
jgi:hypothetical protein